MRTIITLLVVIGGLWLSAGILDAWTDQKARTEREQVSEACWTVFENAELPELFDKMYEALEGPRRDNLLADRPFMDAYGVLCDEIAASHVWIKYKR